jgi:crotonobetainyl-CoA:carnitine CoA-transferase CaiB-like acyl-CoA transferase
MKPLEGLRIVSIEQFGAGPYGTMLLADLGAEVIKIENTATGGDPARKTGYMLGTNDSEYFQSFNLNKKSVALDLGTPAGKAALVEMIGTAEAVINNLRGDLPKKLGLDYETLSKTNPAIVCVHLSAYGRDNERKAWPGYDYIMQAETGLMDLTGDPDNPPSRFGAPSIIDQEAGLTAAVGLLAAIVQARRAGKGCDVDTCLFDVALHQLGYVACWYLNEKHVTRRVKRSSHFAVAPVQTFPTADGWLFIMCVTEKFWAAMLGVIGRNDLASDPRFGNQALRYANRDALTDILDREVRRHPTAYWLEKFTGILPVAPVLDVAEALDSPFLRAADMIGTVPHPAKLDMRMLANPIKINGRRLERKVCSDLGADNAAYASQSSLVKRAWTS